MRRPEGAPPTCCEHRKNGCRPPAQSYAGSQPGDNGWAREGQSGGSACRRGVAMIEQKENERAVKTGRKKIAAGTGALRKRPRATNCRKPVVGKVGKAGTALAGAGPRFRLAGSSGGRGSWQVQSTRSF